jgi:hypothetical protein
MNFGQQIQVEEKEKYVYIYAFDYFISSCINLSEIKPLCRILRRRSCKDRHALSRREFPCITHYASITRNIHRFKIRKYKFIYLK